MGECIRYTSGKLKNISVQGKQHRQIYPVAQEGLNDKIFKLWSSSVLDYVAVFSYNKWIKIFSPTIILSVLPFFK